MSKSAKRWKNDNTPTPNYPELRIVKPKVIEFKPQTKAQANYVSKINSHNLTFGIGPAGTGKTFCAAAAAIQALKDKQVDRILVTRPVVESGEELGFLPGDLKEKYMPYVTPLIDAMSKLAGKGFVEYLIEHEKIVFTPLAYLRGWTFENAFVILDEAQNVTRTQMKLFLTRIGENSKVVIDGDISQKDIDVDGLDDALKRLSGIPSIAIHRFRNDDIVRSGICKDIILAYSDEPRDTDKEGLNRFLGN